MKRVILETKNLSWLLAALLAFSLASCRKDNSQGFTPGTGTPTITSVHTLSKNVVDSSLTTSVTTYNSSGIATTTTNPNYSPQVTAFDSTTVTGKIGFTYILYGTNLGSVTKVMLNGVSIYFNRALISDKSIIFTIPSTVPTVNQKNELQVATLNGTATYKFTTLTPPPTINAESDFDFWEGSQISVTGQSFGSVTGVTLKATGDKVAIVSKTDTTMVLQFPKSTATESTLLFQYTSGTSTMQTASTQTFNNLDNAYNIFFKNSFQNSWADNSWSHPSGVQSGNPHAYGGTASLQANYPAGGWQIEGWANWYPSFAYDASYKYLTFWVKGGTVDHTLVLVGDKMAGGYGQVQNANAYAAQLITVPAKVWTFFKIPLAASQSDTNPNLLNYWANGSPAQQLGFFLQGMSGDVDETMYFDEVAFIK